MFLPLGKEGFFCARFKPGTICFCDNRTTVLPRVIRDDNGSDTLGLFYGRVKDMVKNCGQVGIGKDFEPFSPYPE